MHKSDGRVLRKLSHPAASSIDHRSWNEKAPEPERRQVSSCLQNNMISFQKMSQRGCETALYSLITVRSQTGSLFKHAEGKKPGDSPDVAPVSGGIM